MPDAHDFPGAIMPDSPELHRLLNALPVPELPPVDLAAIYRADLEVQARTAQKWRRVALAVSALAAGLLLFALGWFVRASIPLREAEVVKAPVPTPAVAPADPRLVDLIAGQQRLLVMLRESNAKHADLQDLLLTLARDVSERDGLQKARLDELAGKLRDFEFATARQFQESERANTALYNVVFATKPKGSQP